MTNEAREMIAAILWKAQALSVEPTSIYKRRTPSAFLDAGDKAREPFLIQADAILAALPEIIAGMVKPLEWEKHPDEQEWYAKLQELEGDTFERGYMILPARSHFTLYDGFMGRARVMGHFTLVTEAIAAANAHYLTTILKDLGLEVVNA